MVKMFLEVFTHFQIIVFIQIISIVFSHSYFKLRAAFLPPLKVIVQGKQNIKNFQHLPGMLVLSIWQVTTKVMRNRTILDVEIGVSENP